MQQSVLVFFFEQVSSIYQRHRWFKRVSLLGLRYMFMSGVIVEIDHFTVVDLVPLVNVRLTVTLF